MDFIFSTGRTCYHGKDKLKARLMDRLTSPRYSAILTTSLPFRFYSSLLHTMVIEEGGRKPKAHLLHYARRGTEKSKERMSSMSSIEVTTLLYCRFKSKKSTESTLYCLSPDELLHTAQEIIEEVSITLRCYMFADIVCPNKSIN